MLAARRDPLHLLGERLPLLGRREPRRALEHIPREAERGVGRERLREPPPLGGDARGEGVPFAQALAARAGRPSARPPTNAHGCGVRTTTSTLRDACFKTTESLVSSAAADRRTPSRRPRRSQCTCSRSLRRHRRLLPVRAAAFFAHGCGGASSLSSSTKRFARLVARRDLAQPCAWRRRGRGRRRSRRRSRGGCAVAHSAVEAGKKNLRRSF